MMKNFEELRTSSFFLSWLKIVQTVATLIMSVGQLRLSLLVSSAIGSVAVRMCYYIDPKGVSSITTSRSSSRRRVAATFLVSMYFYKIPSVASDTNRVTLPSVFRRVAADGNVLRQQSSNANDADVERSETRDIARISVFL